jgi:hypothetical protein
MGQTSDPETLVIHQKTTPNNNPEDFMQHYDHGGSLQSHIKVKCVREQSAEEDIWDYDEQEENRHGSYCSPVITRVIKSRRRRREERGGQKN